MDAADTPAAPEDQAAELPDIQGAETATPESCVLRLRGLPFAVTEQEIREFLSSFEVEEVLIEKRQGGGYRLGLFSLDILLLQF